MQNPAVSCPPEPAHSPVGPGSLSGYGTNRVPQALLLAKVLSMMVSLVAPDTVIPVPGGSPDNPAPGACGLLLLCETLSMNTQHERVLVKPLTPPYGQVPFCGGGGSPALCVLVSRPSVLSSNCECSITSVPPELVPE